MLYQAILLPFRWSLPLILRSVRNLIKLILALQAIKVKCNTGFEDYNSSSFITGVAAKFHNKRYNTHLNTGITV